MAICPPDRPCATPTPSQAKALPSRTGKPRQSPPAQEPDTKPGNSGRLLGLNSGVCTGPAEEGLETTQSGKPCQAKLLGAGALAAHSCEHSFQEKKTNPFWTEKCLEYKTCTLPSPDSEGSVGRAGQTNRHCCISPFVSGMLTGTEQAVLAQPLPC